MQFPKIHDYKNGIHAFLKKLIIKKTFLFSKILILKKLTHSLNNQRLE